MHVEIKNWHDGPVTIITEGETVSLGPFQTAMVSATKFVVKVTEPAPVAPPAAPPVDLP
jgi:acylphosphatase